VSMLTPNAGLTFYDVLRPELLIFGVRRTPNVVISDSTGVAYLSESLQRVTDVKSLGRLRSSSSSTLVTRLATLADRAFSFAAVRAWNVTALLHCDEELSVLYNVLTLTTHVTFFRPCNVFLQRLALAPR